MVDINLLTGIFPTTQRPADSKTYFKTLADLIDLGANDFKAFYYYDRMHALCLEDDKTYVWREENTPGEANGLLVAPFVYPANTINNGIDYSGKSFNFFPQSITAEPVLPVVEDYGAWWTGVGLDFYTYCNLIIINNQIYENYTPETLTIPSLASAGNKIYYAIVADTNLDLLIVPGTEGPNPEFPDLDEETQKAITYVLVDENGLAEIYDVQVYNENIGLPNEYVASTSVPANFDLASILNPDKDIVHIRGTNIVLGNILDFTNNQSVSFAGISSLAFELRTPSEAVSIGIRFRNSTSRISSLVNVAPSAFGYRGVLAGYQSINVPIGAFNLFSDSFNQIRFLFRTVTGTITEVDIDNVRLIYGGDPFQGFNNTYIGLYDTHDLNYLFKDQFVPMVNLNGLKLSRVPLFTDLYTGNAIIYGNVDFVSGLIRRVWATAFIIDNAVYFESVEGQVVHDPADALPRRDVYYLEKLTPTSIGTVGIKKGTPDANPQKPTLDNPIKQVEVGEKLFLGSESTTPPEIVNYLIYNENIGEPDEFTIISMSIGFTSNAVNRPFNETFHINYPILGASGGLIAFNHTTPIPFDQTGNLLVPIYTDGTWTQDSRLHIRIANTIDGDYSNTLNINRNSAIQYGFDHTKVGEWQILSIPASVFILDNTTIDQFEFVLYDVPSGSLDYIRWQTGVNAGPTPPNTTNISVKNESSIEQFIVTNEILFEGVSFNPLLKKITVTPSPFLAIDEGNGIGYIRANSDRLLYGNIGLGSFDLIYGGTGTEGVLSNNSIGVGTNITMQVGSNGSAAFGDGHNLTFLVGIASGYQHLNGGFASAMFGAHHDDAPGNNGYNLLAGIRNKGNGFHGAYIGANLNADNRRTLGGTIFLGGANEDIGASYTTNNADQPMVVIGAGTTGTVYPHALLTKKTIALFRRNGVFNYPYTTIAAIDGSSDARIAITREWAYAKFVTNSTGIGTGNVLNLNNVLGTLYNHQIADTKNYIVYLINPGSVPGGRAMCRINAPSQPTVSGGDLEQGFPFIANRDMYLNVWTPDGVIIRYFFTPAAIVESINRQVEYVINADKVLVATDEGKLHMIALPTTARNCKIDNVLPENGEVEFLNVGSFNMTFVVGDLANVVLNTPDGTVLKPGSACTIIKRGTTNQYWVKGELE